MVDQIKDGDVVALKSGGPKMTVSRLEDNGTMAVCAWFDGNKRDFGTFPVTSLVKVNPAATGPAIAVGRTPSPWS